MSVHDPGTPVSAPERYAWLREGLTVLEFPRLAARAGELLRQPRGDGHTVILFPGYGASGASMSMMRAYLRQLGHDARDWGLGRNDGQVERLLEHALGQVNHVRAQRGGTVSLIGWSLGGYIAREVAREAPDGIRQVITMASPVIGGPKYTMVAERYRRAGYDLDEIEKKVEARNAVPLRVPVTAIYSRSDGIVAWGACVDQRCERTEYVEVSTTHLGMGFSADVYRIVAERLAAARHRPAK